MAEPSPETISPATAGVVVGSSAMLDASWRINQLRSLPRSERQRYCPLALPDKSTAADSFC